MKKFIFCCLVVLMGSCKDKDDAPEADFAPTFVGDYWTGTADPASTINHTWNVTAMSKNQLGIVYTKEVTLSAAGIEVKTEQKFALANVVVNAKDTFTINEEVDVEQTGRATFKQKVEGIGTLVTNAAGTPQINITLRIKNSSTLATTEEYLEFKKK